MNWGTFAFGGEVVFCVVLGFVCLFVLGDGGVSFDYYSSQHTSSFSG